MKILLIDRGGYFLDFALRCINAGHDVRWFLGKLKGGERNCQGDGMGVKKISSWETSMRWADLILTPDNSVYGEALQPWFNRGFPIWGPNKEIAQWELNRGIGSKVLAEIGVEQIPSTSFKNLNDAIAFLKTNPARYVSKLDDDNDTKAMSYVSKSPRDMLFMLEKWKKQGAMKTNFIFQKFVPGIEFAVGGWFGKAGFSSWWCENFEHKKLMSGEIGPNTGEMGTVLHYTQDSPLAEYMLKPLEGHLHRAGYRGYLDVAVMVARDGTPYPLEFTSRPGWPLFEIQQALHPDPVGWIADAMEGRWTFKPREGIATGICMMIPDFPYCTSKHEDRCGYPVYGWDKIASGNFHPTQVCMGEAPDESLNPAPTLVTAGECVCTVSGVGKTVCESADRAYANLKKIELPNSPLYRDDIGEKVKEALQHLHHHGYAKGVRYGSR